MTRCAETEWVALVATVEWRSERRHAQRPVAVRCGSERFEVVDEVHWVVGPAVAGEPLKFVFEAGGSDGRRYRVTAREGHPDRVERLESVARAEPAPDGDRTSDP